MENVLKAMASIVYVNAHREKPSAQEASYRAALLADLSEVTAQLAAVEERYNLTEDDDMLESCIYEELALKAKFRYLICLARSKGVSCGGDVLPSLPLMPRSKA